MVIFVLDGELKVIGTVDGAVKMVLTRHFFAPASLELWLPPGDAVPVGGEYLYESRSGECIVIESEKITSDGLRIISGRGAECLLERRIIKGDRVYFGNIELAVRRAVSYALANDSAMPMVSVGDELCGITETGHIAAYWDELSKWIYSILRPYGASYRMRFDPESAKLVFRVVRGIDRTPEQDYRPAVIFSEALGSIENGEIARSDGKAYSTAYVAGEDGTVVTVNSGSFSCEKRREMYVPAGDIHRSSFDSDADYIAALEHRGLEKLAASGERVSLKVSASGASDGEYTFGEDYDLGDLCRVSVGGIEADVTVSSVTERYIGGIRECVPHFEKY